MRTFCCLAISLLAVLLSGCPTTTDALMNDFGADDATTRTNAEETLRERQQVHFPRLVETLRTGSTLQRRRAAAMLHTLADRSVDPKALAQAFADALGDEDVDVVIHCLRGLGNLRNTDHLDTIVQTLLAHPDLAAKSTAGAALGQIGGPQATARLSQIVTADPQHPSYIRIVAVTALGNSGAAETSLHVLVQILQQTGDAPERKAAELALARLAQRQPGLLAGIAEEFPQMSDVPRASFAAVIAHAGPVFFDEPVYDALLSDPNEAIRAMAVRSLIRTDVIIEYRGAFKQDNVGPVRFGQIQAAVIARLANDTDADVLAAAAWATGHLEARAGIDQLIELLDHPSPGVRHNAVIALRKIANEHFGYQPTAPADRRKQAVEKWKAWTATAKSNSEGSVPG